ncbi:MAG: amino acid-binding protein [Treponema sp.]|nr:amino acid-binding protein [Treponema sp.]
MTVNQISVFLENKPGTLLGLTETLAAHNINMRALSLADTADFGIARIIIDNADNAVTLLRENNYIVKATPVLAFEIADEAGSLHKILALLEKSGQNIEYMYGFTGLKTNRAYMIVRATDAMAAEKALADAGIHLISQNELGNI